MSSRADTQTDRDAELILAVLAGREDAAATLFRRHADAVYAFVLPRTGRDVAAAEDVTQETFLDAWRNLDRFEAGRNFAAWLVGIARRKLARFHRGRARDRSTDSARVLSFLEGTTPHPWDGLVAEEATLTVTDALARLSPEARSLLLAKYRDGRSLKEIGGELGIRPEAVSSRLQRAREAFKLALHATGGRDALAS
jgi:RNA polymerase sigma-70 factor (ECF subfamily)